jgi:flagellin-like protein
MSPDRRPDAGDAPLETGRRHRFARRAQSEVIGVAILTGVVVVVALAIGVVVIAQYSGDDGGLTTDLVLSTSNEEVTLSHNGGDSLDLADLRVTLEQDGTRTTFTPDAANATGGNARLDPGERVRRDHGVDPGDLTVLVVHRPSNSVILEDRATVPP